MFEHIKGKLKNNCYIPNTIIDIGACYGDFTDKMLDIYPLTKYYLFESRNHPELQKFLVKDNVNVFNMLLGKDNNQTLEKINNLDDILSIKDVFIKKDMKNVFIKINCKDNLLSILEGATNILRITNFILIDLPFDDKYNNMSKIFVDYIKFLENKGFILFDNINNYEVETSKRYNMIFINKNYKFNN